MYDTVKRLLDFVMALVLLVLASPFLLLIAVAVRVTLGSPVFFAQERPGRDSKPFTLYKFRTMRLAAHRTSDISALASDQQRLTRFGRFLRASSLDELPELWNILRGDMSFIGPRPLLTEYLDRYNENQARRHEVRPGLTGWAQVNGRNALDWDDRLEMDVWYVDHRSFALDVRILLMTFRAVFSARGISAPGEATMTPFLGSDEGAKKEHE